MPRGFLFLLCSIVVLGQVPPREQFDLAIQSYREARASGNFDQARPPGRSTQSAGANALGFASVAEPDPASCTGPSKLRLARSGPGAAPLAAQPPADKKPPENGGRQ
jgi:hypothetical protein